ncbi:MAG: agmatinase [archaeon]
MSELELHTSIPCRFSGYHHPFDDADYVVVGVPYDRTSTYRADSRFAPRAIREASSNIETFSLRSNIDLEDIKICDVGDLHIVENASETLRRLESVCREIIKPGKTPIVLGGEHTVSFGAVSAISKDAAVVDFDAHMDLRAEYMGERLSHASVMRRISELFGSDKIFEFGVRAFSKEELEFASKEKVWFMPNTRIRRIGLAEAISDLEERISSFEEIYLTIDMDVLDPAYAPGVGNPEGDGMDPYSLIEATCAICKHKVAGIDLVEVAPNFDHGVTAIQAARILFETICATEKHRKKDQ